MHRLSTILWLWVLSNEFPGDLKSGTVWKPAVQLRGCADKLQMGAGEENARPYLS
jgi:hypothetical protein